MGGAHVVNYLHHLLQLRYPSLLPHLSLSLSLQLTHTHATIAIDYGGELWVRERGRREGEERTVQLPCTPVRGARHTHTV